MHGALKGVKGRVHLFWNKIFLPRKGVDYYLSSFLHPLSLYGTLPEEGGDTRPAPVVRLLNNTKEGGKKH